MRGQLQQMGARIEDRDLYAAFGKRATRGILLDGPPGCGKTLLGKAAATAIAQRHGATAKASGFIYVAGPEILNRWVGASEAGVRELFAAGRRHAAEHGYPAILFLDECDALMGARGGGALGLEGMERTIVPAFLTQMDGLSPQSAIVLLATNRADKLDPAITRDQRIDVKVEVRRPTQTETADIASLYLGRLPVDGDAVAMAADLAAQLFAPARIIGMVRCHHGGDERMTMRDVVSGALVAGVVDRASQIAIRRLRALPEAPRVVNAHDVREAVGEKYREICATAHGGAARDRVGASRFKVFEPQRTGTNGLSIR